MNFAVHYHKKVEFDIAQSKLFYKNQKSGLELLFAREVRKTINQIMINPLIFQRRYNTIRIGYTKLFPYGIHFSVNEEKMKVTIFAVFHTSIPPEKWQRRENQ